MQFDIKSHIAGLFRSALESIAPESAGTPILLERPKQADYGDLACNIALQLAKKLKTNPRQFAERLVVALKSQRMIRGTSPPSPLLKEKGALHGFDESKRSSAV